MRNQEVISKFVNFAESAATANVRSTGDKLFNYYTCIAQRHEGKIILNVTRYSVTTSKMQGYVRRELSGYDVTEVTGVPRGTCNLVPYINKQNNLTAMNVEVKVQTTEGKYLLNEIHPSLKDGDIIKAIRVNQKTGCVDFKWHGVDACLWMGVNCVETKKRKVLNK